MSVAVTCSWGDGDLCDRTVLLPVGEDGMAQAEAAVQTALNTAPPPACWITLDSTAPSTATAPAPCLELAVSSAGVAALCLVANARIIEIHEAAQEEEEREETATSFARPGAAVTAPLLTQEAQLAETSTGLYAHFLCHGSGGALFPPHRRYRLKFFGRVPRTVMCLAKLCVVLAEHEVKEEEEEDCRADAGGKVGASHDKGDDAMAAGRQGVGTSSPPLLPSSSSAADAAPAAPAQMEAVVLDTLFAMQRQLLMTERRVRASLEEVMTRLGSLESRVQRLEEGGRSRSGAEAQPERAGSEAGAEVEEHEESCSPAAPAAADEAEEA